MIHKPPAAWTVSANILIMIYSLLAPELADCLRWVRRNDHTGFVLICLLAAAPISINHLTPAHGIGCSGIWNAKWKHNRPRNICLGYSNKCCMARHSLDELRSREACNSKFIVRRYGSWGIDKLKHTLVFFFQRELMIGLTNQNTYAWSSQTES